MSSRICCQESRRSVVIRRCICVCTWLIDVRRLSMTQNPILRVSERTSRQKIQVCVGQSVVGVSAAVVWKVSEMPNLFRGFCGFFLRGVLTYRYLLNRHCHRGALSLNRNQYHEEVWKERPWRRGRILKSTLCMFELIDCLEDKISWMIEFEQEE